MSFLIFLLFPLFVIAESHLNCSQSGTRLMYINGINVSDKQLLEFGDYTELFHDQLRNVQNKIDIKGNIGSPIHLKNRSESMALDVVETFLLYLEQETSIPADEKIFRLLISSLLDSKKRFNSQCAAYGAMSGSHICKKLQEFIFKASLAEVDIASMKKYVNREMKDGRKIIFLTHSGGALFADRLRDHVKKNFSREDYDMTATVSLARPLASNHERSFFVNHENDMALKFQEIYLFLPIQYNSRFTQVCEAFQEGSIDTRNHSYRCYVGNLKADGDFFLQKPSSPSSADLVKDTVFRAASTLENNDTDCCNKMKNGELWSDHNIFKSKDLKIRGVISGLSGSHKLCAVGNINTEEIIFNNGIDLNGEVEITGKKITLDDVKMSSKSRLVINSGSSGSSYLSRFDLDGLLSSLVPILITDSDFLGKFSIVKDCDLTPCLGFSITYSSIRTPANMHSKIDGASRFSIFNSVFSSGLNVKTTSPTLSLHNIKAKDKFSIHGGYLIVEVQNSNFEKSVNYTNYSGISFLSLKTVNANDLIEVNSSNLSLGFVEIQGPLTHSGCVDCSVAMWNITYGNSNTLSSKRIEIQGLPGGQSLMQNTSLAGNVFIGTESDINGLTVNGGTLHFGRVNIGSGVTANSTDTHGIAVLSPGGGPPINIAPGTTLTGPVSSYCSLSGNVGPNYECYSQGRLNEFLSSVLQKFRGD